MSQISDELRDLSAIDSCDLKNSFGDSDLEYDIPQQINDNKNNEKFQQQNQKIINPKKPVFKEFQKYEQENKVDSPYEQEERYFDHIFNKQPKNQPQQQKNISFTALKKEIEEFEFPEQKKIPNIYPEKINHQKQKQDLLDQLNQKNKHAYIKKEKNVDQDKNFDEEWQKNLKQIKQQRIQKSSLYLQNQKSEKQKEKQVQFNVKQKEVTKCHLCGQDFFTCDYPSHLNECQKYSVEEQCRYCKELILVSFMSEHLQDCIEKLMYDFKLMEFKKDQKECSICTLQFTDYGNDKFLVCFHRYHTHCIDTWLKKSKECPICRIVVIQ